MSDLWIELCQRLATEDDPERFRSIIEELFLRLEEREQELKSCKTDETWKNRCRSA
jgi:hypothetical protein